MYEQSYIQLSDVYDGCQPILCSSIQTPLRHKRAKSGNRDEQSAMNDGIDICLHKKKVAIFVRLSLLFLITCTCVRLVSMQIAQCTQLRIKHRTDIVLHPGYTALAPSGSLHYNYRATLGNGAMRRSPQVRPRYQEGGQPPSYFPLGTHRVYGDMTVCKYKN
jgi:hypothetical protein